MLELNNYLAAGALWDVVYRQEPDHLAELSALVELQRLLGNGGYAYYVEEDRLNATDTHDYVMSQLQTRMNEVLYQHKRNPNIAHDRALRLAGSDGVQGPPGFAIYKVRNHDGQYGHLRFACSTERFTLRLKYYQERVTPGRPTRPIYTLASEISSFGRRFNTVTYDELDLANWSKLLEELLETVQNYAVQRPGLVDFIDGALDHLYELNHQQKDSPHVAIEAI